MDPLSCNLDKGKMTKNETNDNLSSAYLSLTSSLFEIYLTGLVAHVLQELACISPFGQMTYGTTTYQERRLVFCLFLLPRPPGLSIRASQLAPGSTQLVPRPSQQAPKALPTGSRALLACPETLPASYRAHPAGSTALTAGSQGPPNWLQGPPTL